MLDLKVGGSGLEILEVMGDVFVCRGEAMIGDGWVGCNNNVFEDQWQLE